MKNYIDLYMQYQDNCHHQDRVSPSIDEDPAFSFPSSQAGYFIASSSSAPVAQHNNHYFPDYYPTTVQQIMYNPFLSPNGTFTTTPSPTSTNSSTSLHNMSTNPLYQIDHSQMVMHELSSHSISGSFGGGHGVTDMSLSSSSTNYTDFDITEPNYYQSKQCGTYPIDSRRSSLGYPIDATAGKTSSSNQSTGSSSHQERQHKKHSKRRSAASNEKKKHCSNCGSTHSPSWRRSIAKQSKGNLLCNACGLYEKTAKKKRMLVTAEDGNTKVVRKRDSHDYCCSICGITDATRWRKSYDNHLLCEKCARHQRNHTATSV